MQVTRHRWLNPLKQLVTSASPNLKDDYNTQLVHDEKVYPESKPKS